MGKRERRIFTEEFRREAVRLTVTSGRTIVQIANDLGLGLSTLTRWKRQHRDADLLAGPHEDVNKELARLRKENELLRQGDKSMKFRLIDANKADMPVDRMCALLDVSVSGYYAWKKRAPSQHQLDDFVLLAHIRAQFALSNETYGSPRMHVEIREDGVQAGRHHLARLMRANGLKATQRRRLRKTTDSHHGRPVAANILDQNFACDGQDQKWGVDISYIWTAEGWLYLAIVLDLFSRRIIGWAVSARLKKDLALNALRRAITIRQPSAGLIHHSDRGSQYCSGDYQKLLGCRGIIASMSGPEDAYLYLNLQGYQ